VLTGRSRRRVAGPAGHFDWAASICFLKSVQLVSFGRCSYTGVSSPGTRLQGSPIQQ
jgi:hypothetical protein